MSKRSKYALRKPSVAFTSRSSTVCERSSRVRGLGVGGGSGLVTRSRITRDALPDPGFTSAALPDPFDRGLEGAPLAWVDFDRGLLAGSTLPGAGVLRATALAGAALAAGALAGGAALATGALGAVFSTTGALLALGAGDFSTTGALLAGFTAGGRGVVTLAGLLGGPLDGLLETGLGVEWTAGAALEAFIFGFAVLRSGRAAMVRRTLTNRPRNGQTAYQLPTCNHLK